MEYSNVLTVVLERLAQVCDVRQVRAHQRLGNLALDSIKITDYLAGTPNTLVSLKQV